MVRAFYHSNRKVIDTRGFFFFEILKQKGKFLEEREAASRIGERARGRATGDRGEQNTVYTQIDDICIKIIIEIR